MCLKTCGQVKLAVCACARICCNIIDPLPVKCTSEVKADFCAGRGEGAGGADRDEAGDGTVHEDAGERHLREAGRSRGAPAAAGRPPCHQPTAQPQVTGEAALPNLTPVQEACRTLTRCFVCLTARNIKM